MDLILCHQTVDFDALGAAIGLTRLKSGAKIVLTGGAHPTVRDFLALHRDEFALIELRSVDPKRIRSLTIVDTQKRQRLGKAAEWLDLPNIEKIELYDHHLDSESDISATISHIEPVGATTTIIVELLQAANIKLTTWEATAMALGIHVDTGSLTFEQTTARDARALAWLLEMGAKIKTIAEYVEPSLSPQLQKLLQQGLESIQKYTVQGYTIGTVWLESDHFIAGLSGLTSNLLELTECDALLLAHAYQQNNRPKLTIIGRSRLEKTDLNQLFAAYGGGGHAQAASVNIQADNRQEIFASLLEELKAQIPQPPVARDLMSSPVRTILPDTTIEEAQRILFRYGHSGLSVVSETGELVGIISRRDIDLALHHGFSHAPVKGYMTTHLKTITPDTPLPEIESLMVTYDIGRLPVLEAGKLVGIVTRSDVLRQLYQEREEINHKDGQISLRTSCLLPSIKSQLPPAISQLLFKISQAAKAKGWHLYLVGGAVRDLLLAKPDEIIMLQDIDLVVDGFHRAADVGAGVELAKMIQASYPNARLSVHGEFQTAALIWHKDPVFDSLLLDIATARTEFYPYPAANPEVEASSIRQDLYRRDFTINALALRLTPPKGGELLDFFGGLLDLQARQIRVLHPNSFIEDPTRIYRAVRFAVRLNFKIETQTENYIRYAIASGIYEKLRLDNQAAPALTTRLRAELKYILEANYWKSALKLLADLGALQCVHPALELTPQLWWQIRYLSRWLRYLAAEIKTDDWLMRLEILISSLPAAERSQVARRLQLPKDSIERLATLAADLAAIQTKLPTFSAIS
ncbi:MAG: CBS domain-containing protein, partial [Cyanobacteria bacterium J083]